MHKIKFPIGDWSEDGHGKCDWFIVKSSKPLDDLIEAHFAFKEKAGFDIGDLCGDYEDNRIRGSQAAFIVKHGFLTDEDKDYEILTEDEEYVDPVDTTCSISAFPENGILNICGSDVMLKIWLGCLKYADPELLLEIQPEEKLPCMYNWSVKDMNTQTGRYLRGPGYGLFH